jgi:arylsulfatase A-like enzyme
VTAPNVLLVMADDQRRDFLPYMPNVRNLIATPGREFTSCRCNVPLCQPSRVGLFTGQTSKHHHVLDNSLEQLAGFDHDDRLGAWLQGAGYRTGLIGKYLNGAPPMVPKPSGWDTWRQLGSDDLQEQLGLGYQVCDGTTITTPAVHQVEYLREEALAFVAGSQPWFLFLAPTSPHVPFSPEPADLFAWSDVHWPLVNELDVSDKPSWIRSFQPLPPTALASFRATARAQLREATSVDRALGVIIGALQASVLANTVIVYCSDNGLEYGEHRRPFNGIAKFPVYDVSMRVPLVMRGPGIPAGVSTEPVTMAADVTATILAIAGAVAGLPPDGVDLRDVIANPTAYASRHLLHEMDEVEFLGTGPPGNGITTATRKLWRFPSKPPTDPDRYEAYDLDTDPDELQNWANDPTRLDERDALEIALDALLEAP